MAMKRREKTRYTGIYKQTGSNLYDVKYNFKEIDETTGETKYKAKWVYSIESLDLAKKTLLQLQTANYDDGEITGGEAYELWLAKARIENYTDVAIKNTGEHLRMIYNFIYPDFKLRNVDYSLYSSFIEKCRAEKVYSEYTVSNLNKTFRKLITLACREGRLKENPLKMLDDTKPQERDRTVIVTAADFAAMDNHLASNSFFRNVVDQNIKRRLALNFLYYTGMTIGEILAVRYQDIISSCEAAGCAQTAFSGYQIQVSGATDTGFIIGLDGAKKSKLCLVPMPEPLVALFFRDKERHLSEGGNIDGLIFSFTHGTIIEMLRKLPPQPGIDKRIECQTFRDIYIEKMVRNGVTLPQLCYVLGESQATIMKRYRYLFENDPQKIIAVFFAEAEK